MSSQLETMMKNEKFAEIGKKIREIQNSGPPPELKALKQQFYDLLIEEKIPYEVAYAWVWNTAKDHAEFCREMAVIREVCLANQGK